MSYRMFGILALAFAAPALAADMTATTIDGRKVVLRDNGTWVFEQTGDKQQDRQHATLTLENKVGLANGCRLGLRLQNDLPAQIRTLVLRFTAYKGEQVAFETVSRGFSYIKPTASQYQEINFRGLGCGDISSVGVEAARNCHVGELTKYSASEARCLELVEVNASDILPIGKIQPSK